MTDSAKVTTYWMACGCIVQMAQVATESKDDAMRFALGHASMPWPEVSRVQRKSKPLYTTSETATVWLVTVRPEDQVCREGLRHPASYVRKGEVT